MMLMMLMMPSAPLVFADSHASTKEAEVLFESAGKIVASPALTPCVPSAFTPPEVRTKSDMRQIRRAHWLF